MAYVSPRTWTTNELVTAAMMNGIRDTLLETAVAKAGASGQVPYANGLNSLAMAAPGSVGQVFGIPVGGGAPAFVPAGATKVGDVTALVPTMNLTITFGSSYQHVLLVGTGRGNTAALFDSLYLYLNGDVSTTYYGELLSVQNTTVTAAPLVGSGGLQIGVQPAGLTAITFGGSFSVLIPFRTSGYYRNIIAHCNAIYGTAAAQQLEYFVSGIWGNSSPVSQVDASLVVGGWAANSRMIAYGLW
jgi:hypothetical protein